MARLSSRLRNEKRQRLLRNRDGWRVAAAFNDLGESGGRLNGYGRSLPAGVIEGGMFTFKWLTR